ncbi:MAG: MATE family efflux transporter, partial [Hyphomicrobiales bacterium]
MSHAHETVRPVTVTHRVVLGIAVPMTLAHLSTPLLGLADATVIGQLGDAALLGAVAVAAVLFDFLFWGFGFLRMGTAGLTAQALGADDAVEQRAVFLRALIMAGTLGVALIALQVPIAHLAIPLFDASPAVATAAEQYFHIRIWSAPLAFANYAILGWLIGMGRTVTGLVLQIGVNLANIVLNIVLALGLSMGIAGVALGTVIAEGAGAVVGILVGDFDPVRAKQLITNYFSRLQPGKTPPPPVVTLEVEQLAEQRMNAVGDVPPSVEIRYHTVPAGHVDSYPLDMLAEILNDRTGRLYKGLVEGRGIAAGAQAMSDTRKYAGLFAVSAQARGAAEPEALEAAWYEE